MMKVVYLYVAVIFGGAFIAMVYFRAQDRGWPNTIVFFGILTVVSVVSVYRAQRKKTREADDASETNRGA
jgi:membrane protein implicated in regulation of membrane protease activity